MKVSGIQPYPTKMLVYINLVETVCTQCIDIISFQMPVLLCIFNVCHGIHTSYTYIPAFTLVHLTQCQFPQSISQCQISTPEWSATAWARVLLVSKSCLWPYTKIKVTMATGPHLFSHFLGSLTCFLSLNGGISQANEHKEIGIEMFVDVNVI